MRKVLLAAVALAVLAIGSTALAGSAPVQVTSTGFNPTNATVESGDPVSWTNAETVTHRVEVIGARAS